VHNQIAKYLKPSSYDPQKTPKAPAMLKRAIAVSLIMSAGGVQRDTEIADTIEGFLDENAELTYGITKLTRAEGFSDLLDRSFYRPGIGFDRDAMCGSALDVVDPRKSVTIARKLGHLEPHSREWYDTLAPYIEKQATAHHNLNRAIRALVDHDPSQPLPPKLMAQAVEMVCLGPHDPVIEHLREAYGGIRFVNR
jgi:hypothetical protein